MTDRAQRPGRGVSRRAAILGTIIVIAALAVGLAIALGGGGTAPASPSPGPGANATSGLGDLPLVTVPPTPTPPAGSPAAVTPPPAAAGSPGASVAPAASPPAEILAKRIRIARLGIDLAIIEGDGVDAPIGKAAHYPGSAWPGGGSNIYIYGHARTGMFIALWQARVGDTIELDLVDGSSRTYVVTKVLPKVPWDAVKYLQPTPTEQLTVQTSTSYYPTAPRFVVIAVPQT